MNSTEWLGLLVLYIVLLAVVRQFTFYRDNYFLQLERNLEMAKKLGRDISFCEVCGTPMVKESEEQTRHAHCSTTKLKMESLTRSYTTYKIKKMSNGLEIIDNVFGKQILGKS